MNRRRTRDAIQKQLGAWYRQFARDLPWRRSSDPYAIWVSEVMLQQTQVSTVIRYYVRFLERFPTVQALAQVSQHEVLKFWQGLGYYRRARHLHRAAQAVVAQHGGAVPSDDAALERLPGIGRYIAGAIQSFAFGNRRAILEANSARVLCRLFAVRGPLHSRAVQERLWQLAEWLVPHRGAGEHNQAVIELGALVCLPQRPRCGICPLAALCAAKRQGRADRLPEHGPRREVISLRAVAAAIRRAGRVLIVRRDEDQWWGGLWELPHTTLADETDPRESLRNHIRASLGLDVSVGRELLRVKHAVTHHRIALSCYEADRVRGRTRLAGYAEFCWKPPGRLADHAYSSPQRKLIAAIVDANRTPGEPVCDA